MNPPLVNLPFRHHHLPLEYLNLILGLLNRHSQLPRPELDLDLQTIRKECSRLVEDIDHL